MPNHVRRILHQSDIPFNTPGNSSSNLNRSFNDRTINMHMRSTFRASVVALTK